MKTSVKSVYLSLAIVLSLSIPVQGETGEIGSKNVVFSDSTSRTQTKSFSLPEKAVVTKASVNTGSVTFSQTGGDVLVTVSGGASTGSHYDPYMYSKTENVTRTSGSNSFSNSVSYNSGGYSGTLYKNGSSYVYSGSYTSADSKWVTNQSSSYYNSGGYSGYLSQYVSGGSYTPADTKTVSMIVGKTQSGYCDTRMGSDWMHCEPKPSHPSTIYYSSGGYSGSIPYQDYNYWSNNSYPSGNGHYRFDWSRTWYYGGTITKPATDTRTYAYQGTVYRPESDTRIYGQNYSGTVYQGGTNTYYGYNVTLDYELDETAPVGTLSYSPTSWTNDSVTIKLDSVHDIGKAGMKHITLPNGNIVTTQSASYTVSTNGNYSFKVTDNVENTNLYTADVSNIDKTLPTGSVVADRTDWTNLSYGLELNNLLDSESGVRRIQLPNGTWMPFTTSSGYRYIVSTNGTYEYKVEDYAGNVRQLSYLVNNIDKVEPTAVVTFDGSSPIDGLNVNLKASDNSSGIKHITLPNGNKISNVDASWSTTEFGNFEFEVEDRAGNISRVPVKVEEPTISISRDKLEVVVTVDGHYSTSPITTRAETGDTRTTKTFRLPITKNETFTFRTNDGGVYSGTKDFTIDNFFMLSKPQIDIQYDEKWTKNDVVLHLSVYSLKNRGIVSTELPNGNSTSLLNFTFTVKNNGMYTFISKDVDGQIGYASVVVKNIDKKTPEIELVTPADWVNKDVPVDIRVTNN